MFVGHNVRSNSLLTRFLPFTFLNHSLYCNQEQEKKNLIKKKREMEGDNNNGNGMHKECLRNHAASLGSYATDGCGEFSPDDTSAALNCAACGCHRNFHRKVTKSGPHEFSVGPVEPIMVYSPDQSSSKKRFRTKFTEEQKEEMAGFAEKLGWKMKQRRDGEDDIDRFCKGVGISRKVFKVWMHNHKNNSGSVAAASNGNTSSLTDD